MSAQESRISSSAMLSEAADRMKKFGRDTLPVIEDREIVGTITEGEIAAAIAEGMDPTTTPVKYTMTPDDIYTHEVMETAVKGTQ